MASTCLLPDGCAVGALVCEVREVQAVRTAVEAAGWRKGAGCIVELGAHDLQALGAGALDAGRQWRKAVHLNPLGAATMDAGTDIPEVIASLLAERRALWASGLRQPAPGHIRRAPAPPGAWFTFAELFAGVGGFRCGLEPLGGECVFASELDPVARLIYEHNHADVPAGDIMGIASDEIGPHDILTAGFPCQPFSQCGKQPGMLDRRGQLFYEVVRVARRWRPKLLLLENVSNLMNTNQGFDFAQILAALQDAGYETCTRVLNSAELLPQRRNRLYFVAFRSDLATAARAFEWPAFKRATAADAPQTEHGRSGLDSGGGSQGEEAVARVAVRTILQPASEVDASYTLLPSLWASVCAREKGAFQKRLVRLDGVSGTLMSSYRRAPLIYSQFVPASPTDGAARLGAGDGLGDRAGARAAEEPALKAGQEATDGSALGHAGSTDEACAQCASSGPACPPPRFFTERECCRLQGFDDSFRLGDHGQTHRFYHCIGNAVCPPVIREIGKAALRALLVEAAEAASGDDGARGTTAEPLFPRLGLGRPQGAGGEPLPAVPYPLVWKHRAAQPADGQAALQSPPSQTGAEKPERTAAQRKPELGPEAAASNKRQRGRPA